jgi:hypothetical protein
MQSVVSNKRCIPTPKRVEQGINAQWSFGFGFAKKVLNKP